MELSRAGIDDNEAISFKEADINVGFHEEKPTKGRELDIFEGKVVQ